MPTVAPYLRNRGEYVSGYERRDAVLRQTSTAQLQQWLKEALSVGNHYAAGLYITEIEARKRK